MLAYRKLLIFCGILYVAEGARTCPESVKAHLTRCDMYYKCMTLPSDNLVWIAKICPSGLVYDTKYKNCVLPDDDWECHLDESESRSSGSDEDNVYGVNNLSYLRDKVKGYDIEDSVESSDENSAADGSNEHVVITMLKNGTMTFASNNNSESNSNEIESSGDGDDSEQQEQENKNGYIPLPANSDMVTSHLQRLSQLIKQANQDENNVNDLSSDDLNQILASHNLKLHSLNPNAEPLPHNKLIDEQHLAQIIDLQKKLNNFANVRNAYSTTPSPIKYTASSNGYYPADATTLHINTVNKMKHPRFPEVGHSTSQIVVNRPGGTVVFRLPNSNPPPQISDNKSPASHISEDTLKTLLELSKQMSNQATNTPNFVHSLPAQSSGYVQPIIQPVLYNFPWDQLSLFSALNSKIKDKIDNDDEPGMEKISLVKGSVPVDTNAASEPDDTGPTTIVHNHIPITIAQPSTSHAAVSHMHARPTTKRPTEDRYDSYGNKKPADHTDLNDYYPYPPFSEDVPKNPQSLDYPSPFSQPAYAENVEQPQYIQIAQSRPDHYVPVYSNNAIVHNTLRPIPTFASVNGGYTQKFYSTYSPQPHLNSGNVNEFVDIDRKPYPTMSPMNYVPIATASSPKPSYVKPPKSYKHVKKHPQIIDKVDQFDSYETSDAGESKEVFESNDNYANVEQTNNENENVMDLLTSYNTQIKADSVSLSKSNEAKKPQFQYKTVNGVNPNHKQFVNLNGNFMSLETYQDTIEPFLQQNAALSSQIEVLTCATGVRQANSTDCTRYFVCNEKTGKVLSYSCPPYTAFNANTKICNAETYSRCFPGNFNSGGKVGHQQLQQSMIEANRIQTEAVKAQHLAQLIKLETDKILKSQQMKLNQANSSAAKATTQVISPTRPTKRRKPETNGSSHKINQQSSTAHKGKRKIPCKAEGNLVDKFSKHHYFLCFKDQTSTMRARRLLCPANLVFCPSKLVCTAAERCTNWNANVGV